MPVQLRDRGPGQARDVALDPIADGFLRLGNVTVADRKSVQRFAVQLQLG